MILIRRENFENNKEMMEFAGEIVKSIIEEKKIEYKYFFDLYKSNAISEDERKAVSEYLDFLRSIDGLEFDGQGELIN